LYHILLPVIVYDNKAVQGSVTAVCTDELNTKITCFISCLYISKMAPEEIRVPDSLYNLGVAAVIDNYLCFRDELRILPDNLLFDLYYKVRILVLLIVAYDGTTNFTKYDKTFEIRSASFSHLYIQLIIIASIY
jgi:hypothetical protein